MQGIKEGIAMKQGGGMLLSVITETRNALDYLALIGECPSHNATFHFEYSVL
jgi:hypothetical protein